MCDKCDDTGIVTVMIMNNPDTYQDFCDCPIGEEKRSEYVGYLESKGEDAAQDKIDRDRSPY